MEKNEAMKMTIGSTWNAKTTPNGPPLVPRGPNRNWLPTSAYPSIAFTPTPMALNTLPKSVRSTRMANRNCNPLPHNLENELALIRPLRRDAESVLHHVGSLFHAVFFGVVQAA